MSKKLPCDHSYSEVWVHPKNWKTLTTKNYCAQIGMFNANSQTLYLQKNIPAVSLSEKD